MIRPITYITLTFFINDYLVEWNNCQASKQASKQVDNPYILLGEPVGRDISLSTGSLRLRMVVHRKGHPKTRHAKLGMAREFRYMTFWQSVGEGENRPEKGGFVQSDTRPCSVRHQTLFSVGLDKVRCRTSISSLPEDCR